MDRQGPEAIMRSKTKVMTVEDRLAAFPTIHTYLLVIALDLPGSPVKIHERVNQAFHQSSLGLIFHHLYILAATVAKYVAEESHLVLPAFS